MMHFRIHLNPWLIAAAAGLLALLGLSGCYDMREAVGANQPKPLTVKDLHDATARLPITASPESPDGLEAGAMANTPGIANRPANTAQPASPMQLAYANVSNDVADTPAPAINTFGEFNDVVRPAPREIPQLNLEQHTFAGEGTDDAVTIDPSGRWMLFTSTRHSTHPQIYLQRVDGTSVTQLTSDGSDHAFPTYSPDGRHIAFACTRGGTWAIYIMDADGRNIVQITNGASQDLHPSFSPDGRRLVYCSMGLTGGQWQLWTVDLTTNIHRMIGYGLFPTWSPAREKDQIAFQRARQRGSRWFSIWTCELIDGEARNMTEVAVSQNAALVSPCWSPDGHQLAFAAIVEPMKSPAGQIRGPQDVWTVSVDGSNRRRLTDGTADHAEPFWASDNRVYFISDRGGSECIWSAQGESAAPPVAQTLEGGKSPTGAADTRSVP